MKHIYLADLTNYTEAEVKSHLVAEYSGEDGNYGTEEDREKLSKQLEDYNVVVAYESVGSWGCDSSSYFLLRHKETGEYFETLGSHCSCYGFEGQFSLDPAPLEYLKSDRFYLCCGGYDDDAEDNKIAVKEFLANL